MCLNLLHVMFATLIIISSCRLGNAFNERHVNFKSGRSVYFCNKLFTAWDFNIISSETAKLRRAHIKTDFQVQICWLQMHLLCATSTCIPVLCGKCWLHFCRKNLRPSEPELENGVVESGVWSSLSVSGLICLSSLSWLVQEWPYTTLLSTNSAL